MLKIFQGLRPLAPAPARGSAPGPRWGLHSQTPADGARSAALRDTKLAPRGPQAKIPGGPETIVTPLNTGKATFYPATFYPATFYPNFHLGNKIFLNSNIYICIEPNKYVYQIYIFYKPIWQLTVNERGHYADSEDTILFKIEDSPDTRL